MFWNLATWLYIIACYLSSSLLYLFPNNWPEPTGITSYFCLAMGQAIVSAGPGYAAEVVAISWSWWQNSPPFQHMASSSSNAVLSILHISHLSKSAWEEKQTFMLRQNVSLEILLTLSHICLTVLQFCYWLYACQMNKFSPIY